MPSPSNSGPGPSFRRIFGCVALGHALLIFLTAFWQTFRPLPKPPAAIEMFDPGDLVQGRPDGSVLPAPGKPSAEIPQPAPAPIPKATAVVAPPPSVKPPEPQEEPPDPEPAPAEPNAFSPAEPVSAKPPPKSKPKPKPTNKPQSPAPASKKPKIDLTEVTRSSNQGEASSSNKQATGAASTTSSNRGGAGGKTSGLNATGIRARLGASLDRAGVSSGVTIGPSGVPGGTGGAFSDYYTLIRDQMYDAWDQPVTLVGKNLQTQIKIALEPSGRISRVTLQRSSGNAEHDASALAAARSVGRLRRPLPDGFNPVVTINFKMEK